MGLGAHFGAEPLSELLLVNLDFCFFTNVFNIFVVCLYKYAILGLRDPFKLVDLVEIYNFPLQMLKTTLQVP